MSKKQFNVRLDPVDIAKFQLVRDTMQDRLGGLSNITNDALFLDMLETYAKVRKIDISGVKLDDDRT